MDSYEHIWRKKADNLDIDPSDKLWNGIELQLENDELKHKLKRRHKFQIAAAIAVIFTLSIWFVSNESISSSESIVMDLDIEEEDNIRFEHIRILESHIKANRF